MSDTGKTLIGIDVGGTFTDLIAFDPASGQIRAVKTPSQRAAPDLAVLAALEKSGVAAGAVGRIVHGTTVATNALLERRGSRIGLITTEGFRDVLELGRTTRLVPGTLYDPYFARPAPLIERRDRLTVRERVTADGRVEHPVEKPALMAAAEQLRADGVEAVVIAFVNSFRNPANETAARDILAAYFEHVVTSTGILNEVREFERFSAAAINGYVMPAMASYTGRLGAELGARYARSSFYTVASHAGLLSGPEVRALPARTVLSGPAAGLSASRYLAEILDRPNVITFDMGGTSTDVALIENLRLPLRRETIMDGLVLRLPQLDIHTVGAGGGSIAGFDDGGALTVGPESAGARPGPAAYGHGGDRPTVTDANVFLGRLGGDQNMGGSLDLRGDLAEAVLAETSRRGALSTEALASGILALATTVMAEAVRAISLSRGFDPREFSLLCYGGAGPLHAAEVAAEIGIPEVIVPPNPGAFSAFGALCSALRRDASETLLLTMSDAAMAQATAASAALAETLVAAFEAEGITKEAVDLGQEADMRYVGQAHELTIGLPLACSAQEATRLFTERFQREYGRTDPTRDVQIVNIRAIATVPMAFPELNDPPAGSGTPRASRQIKTTAGSTTALVWNRADLPAQQEIVGPAVIEEMSATTYVPAGWRAQVGGAGAMILSIVPAP